MISIKSTLISYIAYQFSRLQKIRNSQIISSLKKRGLFSCGINTYGVNNLRIDVYQGSESKITIGKYCSIGPDVRIITGGIHPTERISTFPFRAQWQLDGAFIDGMPFSKGEIQIGNDVWIGTGVTILSGIKIGHGSVLAANALITKDVRPYSIVGGNPARELGRRFSEAIIQSLLDIRWWDFPDLLIQEHLGLFDLPLDRHTIEKLLAIKNKL